METGHVVNLSEITLGEAEKIKNEGAELELRADGKMIIYTKNPDDKRVYKDMKGGMHDAGDTDYR